MFSAISSMVAIYFVLWWIVLFVTLPFGVRNHDETGDTTIAGTDPGAPVKTLLGRKLLWTTVLSAVIFGLGLIAYRAGYMNVDRLADLMGMSGSRLKMD